MNISASPLKIGFIIEPLTELPLFFPSTLGREEEDNGLKGAKREAEHLISALCSPIGVDFLHCCRASDGVFKRAIKRNLTPRVGKERPSHFRPSCCRHHENSKVISICPENPYWGEIMTKQHLPEF